MPVTVPDVPIVATPVAELLHVPPDVTSLKVVLKPWHTAVVPVITAGKGFMVATVVV